MIRSGPAKKLSIYVDETDTLHGKPAYEIAMEILYKKKIAGVSVFRGIAGYGSHRVIHTAKILELSTTLPVKIEAVDSEEMIDSVLPDLLAIIKKGLVEVSGTAVVNLSGETGR